MQQVDYSTTPILPTPAIKPSSPFPVITKINNYIAVSVLLCDAISLKSK